jgi:hypothetical protein
MEPNHYIYLTTNKINGKRYIGRCSNRYKWHNGYLGSGLWLKQAVTKYGEANFTRETLQEVYGGIHEAVVAEEQWIIKLDAKCNPMFYNLSENGGGFDKGDKHTEATKKQISENTSKAMKAKGRDFYVNRKQSSTGRAPANKGKKFVKGTEEWDKRYGSRKQRPRVTTHKRKDKILEKWKIYLEQGGTSERKFISSVGINRFTFRKMLDGTWEPPKRPSKLDQETIVKMLDEYYNKGITQKSLTKKYGITRGTFRKYAAMSKET